MPLVLTVSSLLGGAARTNGPGLLAGATWYEGRAEGDGLVCRFAPGTLASARYITADALLDGNRPYEALGRAARATHERLYRVASGAFADEPRHLPLLFL
jgi:hypothetical protein